MSSTRTAAATGTKKARRPSQKATAPDANREVEVAELPTAAVGQETMADSPAEPMPATEPEALPEKAAEPETSGDAADTTGDAPEAGEAKLSKLDVSALQEKYRELVGRETSSTSKRYLIWKCQQAQKGRIPTGPRDARGPSSEKVDVKVLPMRVPTAAIEPLDAVRRKLGLQSRNEMFRRAMAAFLINAGESDLATHFGATFSVDDAE